MLIFRVFTDAGCSGDIPFPGGIAALNPRLLPQSSLGELKVHTLRFLVLRTILRLK